jgi:hypothetical protein
MHEMMSAVLFTVTEALKALQATGHEMEAISVAKTILGECLKSIYRCLSSGNAACLVAACDLLRELCIAGSLMTMIDFTHTGFAQAARMRKTMPGVTQSPRTAYLDFIMTLLNSTDYESRLILARQPSILHFVISGLQNDEAFVVENVLDTILKTLVLNEEESKNLPVSFLKGNQLQSIAKLYAGSSDLKVQSAIRSFIVGCFGTPTKGLCYPCEPITLLRNRLLADVAAEVDILHDEEAQEMLLITMKSCPDVAWFIFTSNRLPLEPLPGSDYAVAVALAVKLISLIPFNEMSPAEACVPKGLTRNNLSKGVANEDLMVKFNTLMLILAVLKRFGSRLTLVQRTMVKTVLPDFRTVYNAWHQAGPTSTEEDELLGRCFLEVISQYVQSGLHDDASVIRASDIWTIGSSAELAESALLLCELLNPVDILKGLGDVNIIVDLFNTATDKGQVSSILYDWILISRISSDPSFARHVSKDTAAIMGILTAICDVHQKPLLFPGDIDPLASLLGVTDTMQIDEIECSQPSIPELKEPYSQEHRDFEEKIQNFPVIDVKAVKEKINAANAVDMLNSLLATVKRRRVMESFSIIDPSVTVKEYQSLDELLDGLVLGYDSVAWMRLMAAALTHENADKVDLRLLVETAILGYAMIGLSLFQPDIRRLAHFILYNYRTQLRRPSSMREWRQVSMLLDSLSRHSTPQDPLVPISRLVAFFHAEAMPIMLRPDHALYRPLNELFLATPTVFALDVFNQLFFDANEEWERELCWCLGWLDRAMGSQGEYTASCQIDLLHLADNVGTCLLTDALDTITRRLAQRVLLKSAPRWLFSYNNLESS